MRKNETEKTEREPSFRQITVRLSLAPGVRRAALKEHGTKRGIEKAALTLLKAKFRKPFADAAAQAEKDEADGKKARAAERKREAARNKARREKEAEERRVQRLAEKATPEQLEAALALAREKAGPSDA